jgi:hypothetical protein
MSVDFSGEVPLTTLALSRELDSVGDGYQMNVTVPSGTRSGLIYLDIGGLYSYNGEALICVTSCADSSIRNRVRSQRAKTIRSAVRPRFPDSPRVVFRWRPETHQPYNGDQLIN